MSKKKAKTNAVRILEQKKIAFDTREYEYSDTHAAALETAHALGIDENQVFKTLVTVGNKTGPVVAVIPGNKTLDLKKLAKVSGNKKIEMLPMKELESLTGYIHGGCSPVGMKKLFPTYYAEEAKSFDTIHVSAGRRGLQMSVSPEDLLNVTRGQYANLTEDETILG
ncbi:Cys-tRNA(Pro) deacylase [Vagococcus bubulae]|uniref:Cys-tRNA(Pro)/Cys-tRNA(Cys) deacylase n=1 Tax=Vagococcus bubulae TaxID=1977868 RepID=A0A429ZR67_9ENTE|nr:Cys-tRNA(Pro) deacylase [Vagococcus bubulae]RST96186.1 aminoacyl-tRNA deacylase [Vagococcus bubulae]